MLLSYTVRTYSTLQSLCNQHIQAHTGLNHLVVDHVCQYIALILILTSYTSFKYFHLAAPLLSVICILPDLCILWLPYVQIIILTMTIEFLSMICGAL